MFQNESAIDQEICLLPNSMFRFFIIDENKQQNVFGDHEFAVATVRNLTINSSGFGIVEIFTCKFKCFNTKSSTKMASAGTVS